MRDKIAAACGLAFLALLLLTALATSYDLSRFAGVFGEEGLAAPDGSLAAVRLPGFLGWREPQVIGVETSHPYSNTLGNRPAWLLGWHARFEQAMGIVRDHLGQDGAIPRGVVGYLTDLRGVEFEARYHMAAYALAPLQLDPGREQRIVIADFGSAQALARELESGQWLMRVYFGEPTPDSPPLSPGLAILERRTGP